MDPKIITPILMAAVFAWAIYRRIRRTIGRQRLDTSAMQRRIVVFALAGIVIFAMSARSLELAGALVAGMVAGAALGFFGVRHTKFETTREGQFYTPHTYIGLFVTILFLGRLAYRFVYLYPAMQAASKASESPFEAFQRSPLTLAIFGIVLGYYIAYFAAVMKEGRKLARESEIANPGPLAISPQDRGD